MNRSEIASMKFFNGYNCAQSVFYAFCDDLGFDKDMALRVACGFGAGMARRGEVCGAVSGGIMVLGVKFGRGENQDRVLTERTYTQTGELMERFSQRHSSVICRDLLYGCELTTPEGQAEFAKDDLKNKICRKCVATVVEILEEIIKI